MEEERTTGNRVVDIKNVDSSRKLKIAGERLEARAIVEDAQLVPSDTSDVIAALEIEGLLERVAKLPPRYETDVVRGWVNWFSRLSRYDESQLRNAIKDVRSEMKVSVPRRKGDDAPVEDYWEMFRDSLGEMRRDFLSGELLYRDDDGIWKPARNQEDFLKSKAEQRSRAEGVRYYTGMVRPHLAAMEKDAVRSMLIDVPPWDGRDRIGELCAAVKLKADRGLTSEHFQEFVRQWLSRMFQRMRDPKLQNRILILHGLQNAGKDTWVDALVGGLGQWMVRMQVNSNDKDTFLQLHYGLVMNIAEYDKTAKMENSTIKDMITAPDTFLRASYDRRHEFRYSRCSFIATCNVDEILKDPTGARRFLIFEVEKIAWDYPRTEEDKLQVLAQAMHLAETEAVVSDEAETAMRAYLSERTPQDVGDEIVELWEEIVDIHLKGLDVESAHRLRSQGWISRGDAQPVFEKLCKVTGYKHRYVVQKLHAKGLWKHSKYGARYSLSRPNRPIEPERDLEF